MAAKQTWFREAKFGLFIHFGLYSTLAGEYNGVRTRNIAEWIMNDLDIPASDYEKLAAGFNPVDFDAEKIVRMAKEWGMKYIVVTTKHHEGFALFHSSCCSYNSVDAAPCKRDLIKELQLACEANDMKLGFYYSQAQDWDDPDGYAAKKDNSDKNFQSYLDRKCMPQIRELLTNYGKVALMWFDTPMGTTPQQSLQMVSLVKELQPECIVSGRIGNGLGEYMTTGDNFIPRLPYEGDWEAPCTLNDTWGYNRYDKNWKTPEEIIQLLVRVISRGGNYLLNVGPTGTGKIPDESVRILDQVGAYVRANQEAIYSTVRMPVYPYELTWGELTCKKHRLYAHVFRRVPRIEVLNIHNHVKRAYLVETGEDLDFTVDHTCEGDGRIDVELPEGLLNRSYYCVGMELEEEMPLFEPISG